MGHLRDVILYTRNEARLSHFIFLIRLVRRDARYSDQ